MEWYIEAAKQVPALAVLCFVVIYFVKYLEGVSKDFQDRFALLARETHERTIAAGKETEDRLERIIRSQDETVRSVSLAVSSSTEMLGSIRTLLTLVEGDLKRGGIRTTTPSSPSSP